MGLFVGQASLLLSLLSFFFFLFLLSFLLFLDSHKASPCLAQAPPRLRLGVRKVGERRNWPYRLKNYGANNDPEVMNGTSFVCLFFALVIIMARWTDNSILYRTCLLVWFWTCITISCPLYAHKNVGQYLKELMSRVYSNAYFFCKHHA